MISSVNHTLLYILYNFDFIRKSFNPSRCEKTMEQIFPKKDYVSFLRNINNFTCNLRESENFVKSKYYNIINMDSNTLNPPYLNYTNVDSSPFELLMQNFGYAIILIAIAFIVAFIFYTLCCTNLEEKVSEKTVDWRLGLVDDLDFRISNTDPNIRKRSNSESDLEVDATEIERQKKIGCFCHNKISGSNRYYNRYRQIYRYQPIYRYGRYGKCLSVVSVIGQ